ncbi:hypothetical protein ES707_08086 [subsurface metagenome]
MKMKAYIGEVERKSGSSLYTLKNVVEAQSFVRQLIDLLARHVMQAEKMAKDIDGVNRNYGPWASTLSCKGTAGQTFLGVVIGDGDGAVTISQYALQNQLTTNIAHGTVSFAGPTISGASCYIDVIRTFTNNTGAGITIKEVGLYVNAYGPPVFSMIDRSLYELAIGNTEAKTLAYRITVTV